MSLTETCFNYPLSKDSRFKDVCYLGHFEEGVIIYRNPSALISQFKVCTPTPLYSLVVPKPYLFNHHETN